MDNETVEKEYQKAVQERERECAEKVQAVLDNYKCRLLPMVIIVGNTIEQQFKIEAIK